MDKELLRIRDLHVCVEDKEILHGVDLTVGRDETHVLMGPNGTGKSTLGYAVTGNPAYSITGGSVNFDGDDITGLPNGQKRAFFSPFRTRLRYPALRLAHSSAVRLSSGRAVACACGISKRSLKKPWRCWIWTRAMPSAT